MIDGVKQEPYLGKKKTPCANQLFLNIMEHVQRIKNLGKMLFRWWYMMINKNGSV